MIYAGDEYYSDEITSGPIADEDDGPDPKPDPHHPRLSRRSSMVMSARSNTSVGCRPGSVTTT